MTQLTATFTVTIKTKPDGDYYFDHDDLVRNAVPWIEGGLDDRDDIAEVTITEQPAAVSAAVAPPTNQTADEVDADTVANRAAQVITTMGAEIRELTHSRDRYRLAWHNARRRAGVLSAEVTRRAPLLGKYAAEIERLRAELESERDVSRRLLAQRQEMAEERYAWQQRGDRAEAELRRMADETATETTQPARCVCGHPIGLHHEDVCLRTDCGCADALEINAVPEALEAVLTERYTELGNSFSRMRRQEQGPDGWPAERPVGPHHVAETLRELLRRAATDGPGLRLPDHTVNEEETPPPAPRDRHRAAWNALTPQQQAAYLAQLDSAGARQDQTTTDEPERCAHCTHPKRDHDGRADHRAKHSPLVAGDPWCHACDGPCDYAAGARQDQTATDQPAPGSTETRPCRTSVSGGTVWCCEEGETDCPCVCHQPAAGARQDGATQ